MSDLVVCWDRVAVLHRKQEEQVLCLRLVQKGSILRKFG